MIRLLLGTWAFYWLLVLVLPIESTEGSIFSALTIQAGFVITVLAPLCFLRPLLGRGTIAGCETMFTDNQAYSLASLALLVSVVGVAASLYDKAAIQGVDYTQGIAYARENWRTLRENTNAVSSPYSVLGYILGSYYFVSAMLLILKWRHFSGARKVTLASGILLVAISGSAVLGGRSSLLLLVAFILAGLSLKFARQRFHIRFRKQTIYVAAVMALLMLPVASYTVYITGKRAEMTGVPINEYVGNFLPHLNSRFATWFEELSTDFAVLQYTYPLIFSIVYLTHSISTTAAIVDYQPSMADEGKILFTHGISLLSKIGLAETPNSQWFLAGRFPSLPGALFHDYGWVGIIYGGVLFGLIVGLSEIWVKHSPRTPLAVSIYFLLGMALVLSPYVWAFDLLAGYFIMLALFIVCLIHFAQKNIRRASSTREAISAGAHNQ
jgi:oligosaccharide repeat unit polymerase